ncbi:hypothetical protein RJ639_029098 [Escallonia herrerae]|uniref:Uncharacterized protein n=1 Tax=Escallonia herrerae TaxID=1293975 RepID=A0AA88XCY9_9ASTE|nr:hypothetical protein RJ639_029098 [Escallonia herrerae]
MGEERNVEVDSEADSGLEALLLCVRDGVRRCSGGDWVLRDAGHQLPQPSARSPPPPERSRRFTSCHDLMMGKVNKERLGEYLGELQRKENTNDRYVAALRGETLTRKPYVRIQPVPKQSDKEVDKK